MTPKVCRFSSGELALLRRRFEKLEEVTPFEEDIDLAARIASYGMFREVGTVNDELARFIFDADSKRPVRLQSLKAELIQWNGLSGLRIYSTDTRRMELRTRGFYDVVHPLLSVNADGSLHSLFIFPQIVAKIAKSQGVDLVLVKSWGRNSIFGGFDPSQGYYQTNFWELQNNDALKFADLVRRGSLAFLGTHDLIAHIAAVDSGQWPSLKENAEKVYQAILAYFRSVKNPSVSALILPYTIGVVLDDLAQPPSYGSKSHIAVLGLLLAKLARNEIPANLPTLLTRFPDSFQKIIELSRESGVEEKPAKIQAVIDLMIREILSFSVVKSA